MDRTAFSESDFPLGDFSESDVQDFGQKYEDLLPSPRWKKRSIIRDKLARFDMYQRRAVFNIPVFFVGSSMAVTVSDQNAPGCKNRFVGLCIQKVSKGLSSYFRLRNTIDGHGVEVVYDLYCPLIISIEVLKLEKRIDYNLLYLRDAPSSYSTVPWDMKAVRPPKDGSVPVNDIKVPLNTVPWERRWDIKNYKGIILPELPYAWLKKKWRHFHHTNWIQYEDYDLMKNYRYQRHHWDTKAILQRRSSELAQLKQLNRQ